MFAHESAEMVSAWALVSPHILLRIGLLSDQKMLSFTWMASLQWVQLSSKSNFRCHSCYWLPVYIYTQFEDMYVHINICCIYIYIYTYLYIHKLYIMHEKTLSERLGIHSPLRVIAIYQPDRFCDENICSTAQCSSGCSHSIVLLRISLCTSLCRFVYRWFSS